MGARSGTEFEWSDTDEITAHRTVIIRQKVDAGAAAVHRGDYERALALYAEAIAMDQLNAVMFSNRSAILLKMGRSLEALEDAETAQRLDPTWTKAWLRKGWALKCMGQMEQALVAFARGFVQEQMNQQDRGEKEQRNADQRNDQLFSEMIDTVKNMKIKDRFNSVYAQLKPLHMDTSPFLLLSIVGQELLEGCVGDPTGLQCSIEILECALTINTKSLKLRQSVLSALSCGYWALQNISQAINYMEQHMATARAFGDEENELQAHQNLGMALTAQGKDADAVRHYQAALGLAAKIGDQSSMIGSLSSLGQAYSRLFDHSNAVASHSECIRVIESAPSGLVNNEGGKQLAREQGALGSAYLAMGEWEMARQSYENQLRTAKGAKNLAEEARAMASIGSLHQQRREPDQALNWFTQAMKLAKQAKDRQTEGKLASSLSSLHRGLRNQERARKWAQKQLQIGLDLRDKTMIAKACANLGLICAGAGQVEHAVKLHRRQLDLAEAEQDTAGCLRAYGMLGSACLATGKAEEALGYHRAELKLARSLQDKVSEASAYGNFAAACLALKQPEQAFTKLKCQLELGKELKDLPNQSRALCALGHYHADHLGDQEGAIDYFEQYLCVAQEQDDVESERRACHCLGQAYSSLNRPREAARYYNQELALAKDLGDHMVMAWVYGELGEIYLNLGQLDEALECEKYSMALASILRVVNLKCTALRRIGDILLARGSGPAALKVYGKQLTLSTLSGEKKLEAKAYASLGNAFKTLRQYDKSMAFFMQQLAVYEELGDQRGQYNAHGDIGALHEMRGKFPAAVKSYEDQAEIGRTISDILLEAQAVGRTGHACVALSFFEDAIHSYEEQLNLLAKLPVNRSNRDFLMSLMALGECYQKVGRVRDSTNCYNRYLELSSFNCGAKIKGNGGSFLTKLEQMDVSSLISIFHVFDKLSQLSLALCRPDDSLRYAQLQLAIACRLSDRSTNRGQDGIEISSPRDQTIQSQSEVAQTLLTAYRAMACAHFCKKPPALPLALDYLSKRIQVACDHHLLAFEPVAYADLTRLQYLTGDFESAKVTTNRCLSSAIAHEDMEYQHCAQLLMGRLWMQERDWLTAEELLHNSLDIARELEDNGLICQSTLNLAGSLLGQLKLDEATQRANEARAWADMMSRSEDLVGSHVLLAMVHWLKSDVEAAVKDLESAIRVFLVTLVPAHTVIDPFSVRDNLFDVIDIAWQLLVVAYAMVDDVTAGEVACKTALIRERCRQARLAQQFSSLGDLRGKGFGERAVALKHKHSISALRSMDLLELLDQKELVGQLSNLDGLAVDISPVLNGSFMVAWLWSPGCEDISMSLIQLPNNDVMTASGAFDPFPTADNYSGFVAQSLFELLLPPLIHKIVRDFSGSPPIVSTGDPSADLLAVADRLLSPFDVKLKRKYCLDSDKSAMNAAGNNCDESNDGSRDLVAVDNKNAIFILSPDLRSCSKMYEKSSVSIVNIGTILETFRSARLPTAAWEVRYLPSFLWQFLTNVPLAKSMPFAGQLENCVDNSEFNRADDSKHDVFVDLSFVSCKQCWELSNPKVAESLFYFDWFRPTSTPTEDCAEDVLKRRILRMLTSTTGCVFLCGRFHDQGRISLMNFGEAQKSHDHHKSTQLSSSHQGPPSDRDVVLVDEFDNISVDSGNQVDVEEEGGDSEESSGGLAKPPARQGVDEPDLQGDDQGACMSVDDLMTVIAGGFRVRCRMVVIVPVSDGVESATDGLVQRCSGDNQRTVEASTQQWASVLCGLGVPDVVVCNKTCSDLKLIHFLIENHLSTAIGDSSNKSGLDVSKFLRFLRNMKGSSGNNEESTGQSVSSDWTVWGIGGYGSRSGPGHLGKFDGTNENVRSFGKSLRKMLETPEDCRAAFHILLHLIEKSLQRQLVADCKPMYTAEENVRHKTGPEVAGWMDFLEIVGFERRNIVRNQDGNHSGPDSSKSQSPAQGCGIYFPSSDPYGLLKKGCEVLRTLQNMTANSLNALSKLTQLPEDCICALLGKLKSIASKLDCAGNGNFETKLSKKLCENSGVKELMVSLGFDLLRNDEQWVFLQTRRLELTRKKHELCIQAIEAIFDDCPSLNQISGVEDFEHNIDVMFAQEKSEKIGGRVDLNSELSSSVLHELSKIRNADFSEFESDFGNSDERSFPSKFLNASKDTGLAKCGLFSVKLGGNSGIFNNSTSAGKKLPRPARRMKGIAHSRAQSHGCLSEDEGSRGRYNGEAGIQNKNSGLLENLENGDNGLRNRGYFSEDEGRLLPSKSNGCTGSRQKEDIAAKIEAFNRDLMASTARVIAVEEENGDWVGRNPSPSARNMAPNTTRKTNRPNEQYDGVAVPSKSFGSFNNYCPQSNYPGKSSHVTNNHLSLQHQEGVYALAGQGNRSVLMDTRTNRLPFQMTSVQNGQKLHNNAGPFHTNSLPRIANRRHVPLQKKNSDDIEVVMEDTGFASDCGYATKAHFNGGNVESANWVSGSNQKELLSASSAHLAGHGNSPLATEKGRLNSSNEIHVGYGCNNAQNNTCSSNGRLLNNTSEAGSPNLPLSMQPDRFTTPSKFVVNNNLQSINGYPPSKLQNCSPLQSQRGEMGSPVRSINSASSSSPQRQNLPRPPPPPYNSGNIYEYHHQQTSTHNKFSNILENNIGIDPTRPRPCSNYGQIQPVVQQSQPHWNSSPANGLGAPRPNGSTGLPSSGTTINGNHGLAERVNQPARDAEALRMRVAARRLVEKQRQAAAANGAGGGGARSGNYHLININNSNAIDSSRNGNYSLLNNVSGNAIDVGRNVAARIVANKTNVVRSQTPTMLGYNESLADSSPIQNNYCGLERTSPPSQDNHRMAPHQRRNLADANGAAIRSAQKVTHIPYASNSVNNFHNGVDLQGLLDSSANRQTRDLSNCNNQIRDTEGPQRSVANRDNCAFPSVDSSGSPNRLGFPQNGFAGGTSNFRLTNGNLGNSNYVHSSSPAGRYCHTNGNNSQNNQYSYLNYLPESGQTERFGYSAVAATCSTVSQSGNPIRDTNDFYRYSAAKVSGENYFVNHASSRGVSEANSHNYSPHSQYDVVTAAGDGVYYSCPPSGRQIVFTATAQGDGNFLANGGTRGQNHQSNNNCVPAVSKLRDSGPAENGCFSTAATSGSATASPARTPNCYNVRMQAEKFSGGCH